MILVLCLDPKRRDGGQYSFKEFIMRRNTKAGGGG